MAITIDIGEGKNLHPPDKSGVGHRLALAARHVAYGEDIVFSGPLYASHKVDGDRILVSFKNAGKGLKIGTPPVAPPGSQPAPAAELKGFAIAGADKIFVWAKAKIESPDTVSISSNEVKSPAVVRYGWGSDPEVNLYNSGDLPASPFRTDLPDHP